MSGRSAGPGRGADGRGSGRPLREDEAAVLLEQVRWQCEQVVVRIESFNQRAGAILATSLAVAALIAPLVLPKADRWWEWASLGAALCGLAVAAVLSLSVLKVGTGHDIGFKNSEAIRRSVTGTDGAGPLPEGVGLSAALLDSLTLAPAAPGTLSVADQLNGAADRKGGRLALSQWALAGGAALTVAATLLTTITGE